VTPLDVVRVRLQSQTPSSASRPSPAFSAYTTSFKRLPPDLGVTACCREVFWFGDNAQFCIAANHGTASAAECAVEETQKRTFTSTLDGLRKIARNEGAFSLWRGLSPTLVMAIPANVIYFTGYDWLRFNHASPIQGIASDAYAPLVAGSVARVAAAIAVSPIEMFRTRMQATRGSSSGVFKSTLLGLYQMTQTQGYTSLWRGLTLTMWRDVPFSGFYWWGYEATRNALTDARERAQGKVLDSNRPMTRRRSQSQDNSTNTFVDSFIAGASSGAVAAFVTTPFDVGKTRQQVFKHSGDESAISASRAALKAGEKLPEELTMPRFLAHIFREEGIHGLFKGWAARCMKVAPACAIMISSYEVGKRWARGMNEKLGENKENM
jgi:solute carrier family 25, member 39/40